MRQHGDAPEEVAVLSVVHLLDADELDVRFSLAKAFE